MEYSLGMAWLIVSLVLALGVQTLLHEAGHLIFGLATGYRFCSFRVGSWMLLKQEGRFRLRRMSIAGTGGQCLLAPPALREGKMPCILYNLGGVWVNLAATLTFGALAALCRENWSLWVLWGAQSMVGGAEALLNGIPMKLSGISNDGWNALSLRKDPAALRSVWVQLSLTEQQTQGQRLKEMPEEWFILPEEADMKNTMTAVLGVLAECRAMDAQQFDEAERLCIWLEDPDKAVVELYRKMLLGDRVYCALLRGQGADVLLARWNEKPQRQFRRQMKDNLSILRTEYTVALLAERDLAEAERIHARFERAAERYPYAGEAASERELLERAARTFAEKDRSREG
ncbi:MAG: hypothetical protein ACI4LE_08635 [Faecalibacterium sp.]